jgi:hypothetical protein
MPIVENKNNEEFGPSLNPTKPWYETQSLKILYMKEWDVVFCINSRTNAFYLSLLPPHHYSRSMVILDLFFFVRVILHQFIILCWHIYHCEYQCNIYHDSSHTEICALLFITPFAGVVSSIWADLQ